jgi:hypothetical protein
MRAILKSKSGLLCLATIILYTYLTFIYQNGNVLSWDVFGYYLYLPQTFIQNDPGIHDVSHVYDILNTYHNSPSFYQAHPVENGNHILQYPIGMAILFSPFFFIGHACAYIFGYPPDGFSTPYQISFLLGYLAYTILAVFLIRKLLLKFFTENTTSLTLLILFFGTNFYSIAIGAIGMPHMYLFVLFACVLLLTIKWHENPTYTTSFLLGAVIGLMTLCRPTEILIAVVPLLYGIKHVREIFPRIKLCFTSYFKYMLVACLAGFLIVLPQLIYWKIYAGRYLFYSYSNPGEGFDFFSPHTLNFLFSFRKGWFIYTPIMFLALFGFYKLYKDKSPWFLPTLIFVVINIYVLSSWSCWWYAGSFSQRPVVQSYPIMCILIGGMVYMILHAKKWLKIISLSFTGFFYTS